MHRAQDRMRKKSCDILYRKQRGKEFGNFGYLECAFRGVTEFYSINTWYMDVELGKGQVAHMLCARHVSSSGCLGVSVAWMV